MSGASPASAEHTGTRTVWSATLTAGDAAPDFGFVDHLFVGTLSERNFTYDRLDYVINELIVTNGTLSTRFNKNPDKLGSSALTLHVGNSLSDLRQFALADATVVFGTTLRWSNSGLSWSDGDTVRLWLTVDESALSLPTLSASMSGVPSEEEADLWSAALTVRDLDTSGSAPANRGCDDGDVSARCSASSVLTDNEFTFGGVEYTVKGISANRRQVTQDPDNPFRLVVFPESLKLTLDKAIPESLQTCLSLEVNGREVPLAGSSLSSSNGVANSTATMTAISGLGWGLNWSAGDTVQLKLPDVACLTLTLSEPVTEATSMQWRRGGTADPYVDYNRISLPTFAAGSTSASTKIEPVDDSVVEGCETVVLAVTMWPGTYWAVRTPYTIYIEDNDGGAACSSLRAAADSVVSGSSIPQGSPGSVGGDDAGALAEPEPEPVLSPFVQQYDVNGNNLIDLVEYAQAGQDYGNKVITFEQFTEVKDAWRAGEEHAAQIKELANQPPTVKTAFGDITLTGRGVSQTISTSGRFSDPDGHTITMIEAVSSDHNVATVAMAADDSSLTVTGGASGTATITVTAHDGHNGRVTDTFTVKVKAAPTVASPVADIGPLLVGGDDTVDLSGVFADADGDTLTFAVDSTDDFVSVALVRYTPSAQMWVLAMGRGTAELTVTAQDSDGNEVSDTFTVTVKEAPTVANPIADIASLESGKAKQISLSGVFADADGDALTLSASSSDTGVASVSSQLDPVTGSATAITVTAVSSGTATVTVTARDSDGNTVADTFDVTVPAAQQQTQYQGGSSDNDSPDDDDGDDDGAGDGLAEDFDPPTDEHALEEPIVLIPGAVHNLTLTATDNNGVQVSWDAPTVGSAPTRYIVHLRPEGGKAGSGNTKRPKAAKTQVKFNKLEPGTTYQVWVRAQNALGKGQRTHATITLPTP